jgi:hypothetical protein
VEIDYRATRRFQRLKYQSLKKVKLLVIFLAIGVPVLYFGSAFAMEFVASKVLSGMIPLLAQHGLYIEEYNHRFIKLTSFRTITLSGAQSAFRCRLPGRGDKLYRGSVYAGGITLYFVSFLKPTAYVSAENIRIAMEQTHIPETGSCYIENGRLKLYEPIRLFDMCDSMKQLLHTVVDLFYTNSAKAELSFQALSTFTMQEKEVKVHLFTTRIKDGLSIRSNEEDMRKVSEEFSLDLVPAELAVISGYPLQTPTIMRITFYAETMAREAYERDHSVPQDSYRHVLWSFLLAREFGAKVAEMITDAHETRPGEPDTDRRLDYRNNRLGREYAGQGIKQEQILGLVKGVREKSEL